MWNFLDWPEEREGWQRHQTRSLWSSARSERRWHVRPRRVCHTQQQETLSTHTPTWTVTTNGTNAPHPRTCEERSQLPPIHRPCTDKGPHSSLSIMHRRTKDQRPEPCHEQEEKLGSTFARACFVGQERSRKVLWAGVNGREPLDFFSGMAGFGWGQEMSLQRPPIRACGPGHS